MTLTEADGRTSLETTGVPIDAVPEERKTFEKGFGSMTQGWSGALDQLADYPATAQKPDGR